MKGVLRALSRAFADQRKVFFVVPSGPSWTKEVSFAPLRVPSRIKERCSSRPFACLRGKGSFLHTTQR